jgi:hypothetical protein
MDYSLCGAVAQLPGIPALLLGYDIGCQFHINFEKRLKVGAQYLQFPPGLDLTVAVGKFHLGAHVTKCFAQFSLSFIHGAAIHDGEVLERLWSILNKGAPNTRGMSNSFRMETLDWHMNEMNWSKLLGICMFGILFDLQVTNTLHYS